MHKKQFFKINSYENTEQSNTSQNSFHTSKNTFYAGEYLNKKKNGKGRLIFSDKSFYEGNFKNDEFEGFGVFRTKKYVYEGQFSCGKKNGKGKLTNFIKNYEYEGEFKNDVKDGYGTEKYFDGSIYKGQFKNDLKEGKGKLISKDKDNNRIEYIGEFKKDKLCGKGIINWSNQRQYYGELNNNEISGFGILKDEKSKYVGYFKSDKKNGYGVTFYSEQNFAILGKWINDNIEGIAVILSFNDNDIVNASIDNKDEKIVNMKNGEIINISLSDDELDKVKESEEYKEMIKIYKCKILPEFQKNGNYYKTEEDL